MESSREETEVLWKYITEDFIQRRSELKTERTMLLLKLISPNVIPNRRTDWGKKLHIYHWLLLRLLPLYRKSAVSDTFILEDMQIIHNMRDYWYEQELQRFYIDTAQHLEKSSAPFNVKRRFRRSCLFCWSESLLIFHEGKSYTIKRDRNFSIATDIVGTLKTSTNKDFILRSEFTTKNTGVRCNSKNNVADCIQTGQSIVEIVSKGKPKQKISIRDTVPSTSSAQEPKMKKYQGFEENDIF